MHGRFLPILIAATARAAYRKLNIAIRTWQGRTQEKKKLGNEEEGT
jgi:hypothetical protein